MMLIYNKRGCSPQTAPSLKNVSIFRLLKKFLISLTELPEIVSGAYNLFKPRAFRFIFASMSGHPFSFNCFALAACKKAHDFMVSFTFGFSKFILIHFFSVHKAAIESAIGTFKPFIAKEFIYE